MQLFFLKLLKCLLGVLNLLYQTSPEDTFVVCVWALVRLNFISFLRSTFSKVQIEFYPIRALDSHKVFTYKRCVQRNSFPNLLFNWSVMSNSYLKIILQLYVRRSKLSDLQLLFYLFRRHSVDLVIEQGSLDTLVTMNLDVKLVVLISF